MAFLSLQYLLLLKLIAFHHHQQGAVHAVDNAGGKRVSDKCPINQHAICNEHSPNTK
jgi:hypothetical protein